MKKCKLCDGACDSILCCKKSDDLNCKDKSDFLNNFYNELIEYINDGRNTDIDKVIIFNNISFPQYENKDSSEYTKILCEFKKIKFIKCDFHSSQLTLSNVEVFFEECTFYKNYSISDNDASILQNDSNPIYKMCTFEEDVSISQNVLISEADNKSNSIEHALFSDCHFKKTILAENIQIKNRLFKNTEDNRFKTLNNFKLINCIIDSDFIFKEFDISELNVEQTTFKGKVKIQFCKLKKASFYNTKFNNLADFYQTEFYDVNFERTDFNQIAVFSEAVFNKDVDFKYTKFLKKSIFRDMIIKGRLDLRNSIFDDEANFLDIRAEENTSKPIQVKNRETARVIKNFYENSNNVIEANKFYALEMKEREKELDKRKMEDLFEWMIFKIHSISSNHSQSWTLALQWIILCGFIASFFGFYSMQDPNLIYVNLTINKAREALILFYCILLLRCAVECAMKCEISTINTLTIFFIYIAYIYITKDTYLSKFAQTLNPFSIMQNGDTINMVQLMFKIVIAYLIYQFIISVRQNTRRK